MNVQTQSLMTDISLGEIAIQPETQAKLTRLHTILDELGSVVVTYSGGVDSAYLLYAAHERLGEHAVGLTIVSPSLTESELDDARAIAKQIGARHIQIEGHETENPSYLENTPQRCYFCKSMGIELAAQIAVQEGFAAVIDGANADDTGDHRPGRKAARERGMRSPLLEAGLTKAEIRALSQQAGLPSWDKPALACLASRIPYGTPISVVALKQIERAEAVVRDLGIHQLRVRHHDDLARIEVPVSDFERLMTHRDQVVGALKALGYTYVTLDIVGFRSGSMNEVLGKGQIANI